MSLTRWRSIFMAILLLVTMRSEAVENTMRIALVRSPKGLDPFTYLSLPEWYIHMNITSALVGLNHENQIVSDLAKKWSVSDEGKTYRFVLHKDRKWSDGSLITPAQILLSLTSQAKHKNAKILQKILRQGPVEEAVFLENDSLVIKLEAPVHNFLYHLTRSEYGVLDIESLVKSKTLTPKTRTSGNYKIESISENNLVLVPNKFSSRLQKNNPQRIEFSVIKDISDIIKKIKKGELDFYEAQSDDILNAANQSGLYQVVDGGLDNLATLQSRKLSPEHTIAVQVLGEFLNKKLLAKTPKKIASQLVAYSVVPSHSTENLSVEEARAKIKNKQISLKMELGEEATKDQLHDAEIIQTEAAKIGIVIEIVKGIKNFRTRWENEDYSLTLARMGVNADDETELLYGYFCTGFKPYKSVQPIVCDAIDAAAKPHSSTEETISSLSTAYQKLNSSGKIVPLYHFPRRFLIPKKWKLKNYNNLIPFPDFTSFQL